MDSIDLPVRAPRRESPFRRWFFMRGIDESSGRPDRRVLRASAWVVFLSLLVAQNPRVHRRRLRSVARFWFCQVLRARGRTYEIRTDGATFVCPPWSSLGAMTAATGSHEPDETEFVRRVVRPGDGVVDAGANIGLFALPLAAVGARVLAFEPNPAAADVLEESARRSGLGAHVTVERVALSDHEGHATFTTDRDAQNMLLDPDATYDVDAAVAVAVRSLDAVAAEKGPWFDDHGLRLLKIDVEGEDERVLAGAFGLVDRFRPIVMIETREGGHDVITLLGARGYRSCWYDMQTATLSEFPGDWAGNYQFHTNVLAVPAERVAEVAAMVSAPGPTRRGAPVRLRWRGHDLT